MCYSTFCATERLSLGTNQGNIPGKDKQVVFIRHGNYKTTIESLVNESKLLEMATFESSEAISVRDEVEKCPVRALRLNTIAKISTSLNSPKILPTEEGFLRDWKGLAQLAGIDGEIVMCIASKTDPTAEIFKAWSKTGSQEKNVSIGTLLSFLRKMDRWDIIDDTAEMIEKDGLNYLRKQDNLDTSRIAGIDADKDILTVDDVCRLEKGLQPQNYDAYLLFAEDDVDFAMQIIDKMENEYKLKLCVKERDLVGGLAFEHKAIMKLIAERCNRLIVVVSPNFLKSEANKFFVTFAQALGIDQRQRKVVPCLYERCQLPPELSYYFLLDYNRAGRFWNFWEKLRDSIHAPNSTAASNGLAVSAETSQYSLQQNARDRRDYNEWNSQSMIQQREPPPPYSSSNDVSNHVNSKDVRVTLSSPPEYRSASNLEIMAHEVQNHISQSVSESNLMDLEKLSDTVRVPVPFDTEDRKNKARPMKWLRRLLPKEKKIREKKRQKMKALEA